MLDGVGLGEAEDLAYRALLRSPSLTVKELSELVELPIPLLRKAIDGLLTVGLADAIEGSPAHYTAIDPRIAIPAAVRSKQAALERTSSAISGYAAEFHERLLRSEPERLVEVLDGPTAIGERLSTLLRTAEREVLAFDEPPYVAAEPWDNPDERDMLTRGVAARAVYAAEVLDVPERLADMEVLAGLGEQARVVPKVPLKMVLVDGRTAIIPLSARAESARTTAVVVWESRLCDALVELFEATWARGTPVFGPRKRKPAKGITPADAELLTLLNAGMKDEAMARQLGLSERTVRRKIADLLTRLDATSRFQAGAQAVRRKWI